MNDIIGRDKEIKLLRKAVDSRKSEFVAIYGRRRVGKTFLVREFFNYQFDFQLTGLANATTKQQLTNFRVTLNRQFPTSEEATPPNWFMGFQRLIDELEKIERGGKKVIFFDELPWLATARSDFMLALEHFWNSWATNRKDIVLIGCGSAAAWMINSLINNHGGLHNRVTQRIQVFPFNLRETELMLQARDSVLNRYQILQLYMVMGGIPFYLDAVTTEKSANQNIEELCFTKGGLLTTEFQNLFTSLFKNAEQSEAIVTALATKIKGLTRKELSSKVGIQSGSGLTRRLVELEESGFIERYTPFGKKTTKVLYRLTDFYSFFYLKFIKNNASFKQGIWLNAIDQSAQRAWMGNAFEQVCLAHVPQIKHALGISGVISDTAVWRSRRKRDDLNNQPGVQIDLLIDRRDQVINLCEAKFSIHPFTITKSYADNLRNKIGRFQSETQTRKAVFLTMITTYGIEQNSYAAALVQHQVTMDDLFQPD